MDEETAPIIREIIERLASGEPVKRIVQDLNRRQVPTRGEVLRRRGLLSPNLAARVGNHWTRNAIAEIVFSPEYSGIHLNYHTISEYDEVANPLTGIVRRKRTLILRKSTRDQLPLDELLDEHADYAVPVPAIVDAGTHLAAQYRFLSRRREARSEGSEGQDALLRGGYVRCGYCNKPMAVRRDRQNPSRTEYFCTHTKQAAWTVKPDCATSSNQMYTAVLDRAVWADIVTGLKSPEVLVALLTRAKDIVGEHEDRVEHMLSGAGHDLAGAYAEMEALTTQAAMPGLHPVARRALNEKMTDVGKRIEQLEDIVREAQKEAANHQAYLRCVEEVRDWAATLREGLDHLSYSGQRNILFMLGVEVSVWKKADPGNQTEHAGRRWQLRTDWEGLNLRRRFGAQALEKYTAERTNNNAVNYGIVNALDLQELLGQPVGKGEPLPPGVLATIRERAEAAATPQPTDGPASDSPES